jgi:SAM-dependent methyltransferase
MNTIDFYSSNASTFIDQYDQVSFEKIHHIWLQHLPSSGVVLDIGAGSGRDARYLSSKNLTVIAVEPAEQLLNLAKQNSNNYHIHWLSDSLPDLKKVLNLGIKFDLVLLSAVWMHIPASDHQRVIRKISSLLKPNGKIIISLRHGPSPDKRIMYSVSSDDIAKYSSQYGLQFKLLSSQKQPDQLGRNDVSWETVILTLPDDGTGAFPLIRNIVVNDNKSSTYKLALLRSLLRIAEGHPGAVIDQTDDYITLPLGLVALYWLKLYKPLVDQYNMQQSSNAEKGLGFIKSTGWDKLRHFSNNDFYIGSIFSNKETCSAIHQTLKDISTTIKNMPVKYITVPGSHNSVFDVNISSSSKNLQPNLLSLDFEYMKSFGSFVVPKQIWESFSRYHRLDLKN